MYLIGPIVLILINLNRKQVKMEKFTNDSTTDTLEHEQRELIRKAAQALGRLGGKAKSAKKAAAVRENGKLGGRPKKQ